MNTFLEDQHHIGFQSIYKVQQAGKLKKFKHQPLKLLDKVNDK